MFSPPYTYSREKLFKAFALAVDEVDTYRKNIAPEYRKDSKVLSELYIKADHLIGRLKRLGDS